jgi:hypothetical protein
MIRQIESEKKNILLLGIAFTIVFITSMLSGILASSIIGSPFSHLSISEILVNVSNNITTMRIVILVEVLTSIGVIFLAVMLYTIFQKENKLLSTLALSWWIAESIMLSISVIGHYGLILMSSEYINADTTGNSHYLTLANFLFYGIYDYGFILHNTFFCLGGIIWYYLFYKYRYIPKLLALWGLIAICLLSVNLVIALFDPEIPGIILFTVPYVPFELVLGLWLILKGKKND